MRLWTLVIALMGAAAAAPTRGAEGDTDFVPLFDGKSLAGWTGATDSYRAEDGKLVCLQGGKGNLFTEKQYADFHLVFEFKLTPGANNGLAIRSPLRAQGNLHLDGIELQILDNTADKFKTLQPYQYHGSVYGVAPAKRGQLRPVGEWNEQEVVCRGSRVKVTLNGSVIVDADLAAVSRPKTLDGQPHPGLERERGHIGFLGHGDRIEVRRIRIRELK